MTEPSVSTTKAEQDFNLLNQHGEEVNVVLPFLNYNHTKREDNENIDLVSLEDEFDSRDEENDLLSCYPNELDFYDKKRGQILRRNAGKKLSAGRKANRKSPQNLKVVLPSSKIICKRVYDNEAGRSYKEERIKNTRIENSRLNKEKNTKAKKVKGADVSNDQSEKKPLSSYLRNSAKETTPGSNETANPPTFYNNSDFVLGSGNSVLKFEDQSLINLLIELQDREITPEDYDLLVQLECSVKPKTLSKAKIDTLRSEKVTNVINDICSICIEDYISRDVRRFLACGHHFHDHCIRTWLSTTSNRCPIDGSEVG